MGVSVNVPVLWVSRHEDILARDYADQGLLEAILRRDIWSPPDAIHFDHHEVRGDFPDVEGALVILPARHHASPEDVSWFKAQLDRLSWSVVILAGDEEWAFPWREIPETPTRRVWTMQPIPEHADISGTLPGGWYPGTDTELWKHRPNVRSLDWFFAGQVTHERRQQCARVLRHLQTLNPTQGYLHETAGYLQGMPQASYMTHLADAKVIPCPSGPCTVDTARTFEALEAGCVPVCDTRRPNDKAPFDYWVLLFGDHPLPTVQDWSEFPDVMKSVLADWPATANKCNAFWQGYKRKLARQLDSDLRAVCGAPASKADPNDLVTVIVSTSPIPSHPSTEIIEETISSIREQLPTAEILIAVDGVRPEQQHRKADYDEYVRRLLWISNFEWHNVLPVVMDEWVHQAGATSKVLDLVESPLLLFVEHDTPLVGEIPWMPLCFLVGCGEANLVRFHHETTILPVHRHLMLGDPYDFHAGAEGSARIVATCAWWQRPHLASTRFYREVMENFDPESRTMIEDVLYGIATSAYLDHGEAGWDDWRLFIYAPVGDMKRSTHLDGRDTDEKYPMVFPVLIGGTP